MEEAKMHVVIIGGSLTGLMHGIAIKRLGHDVTILEQHHSSTREGQAAGIVTMEHSHSFLSRHDLLQDQPYAVNCSSVQILRKDLKVKHEFQRPMKMSSWNVLYYRFRANFDGLESSYCTHVPKESREVGNAVYDQGKRASEVEVIDDKVQIQVEDTIKKSTSTLSGDLVLVSDGSASQMRRLLQPQLKHSYAGYVAWRGTVIESSVSDETRSIFQNKTTIHATEGGYVALYTIPGENGSLGAGKRLLNYVWYTNIPADSPELKEAMTDSTGQQHHHTLPIGKMSRDVWEKQRNLAHRILPPPFAELVDKTTQPFISAISDIDVSQAVHFGGKLLFVGDALMPFRPHVACSTNQAALNATLVEKLLAREIDLATYERQVLDPDGFDVVVALGNIGMIPSSNSLGLTVVSIDAIFLALSAIALAIRLNSRRLTGHRLCLNDYLALLAWVFAAALVSTAVSAVSQGAGQHIQHVNPTNIPKMLQGFAAAETTWILSNTAIKTSILHFYLTLFSVNRRFRILDFGLIGIVVLFGLGAILQTFLLCRPFAKTWRPELSGTCGSLVWSVIATSLVNVLVDISIIILPMPMIWKLQMARWRKVALTLTFGLGLIVCTITITRLAIASRLTTHDFTYDLARLAIVTDLEPLLGIIVACAPLFPPTFKAFKDHIRKPQSTGTSARGFAKMPTRSTTYLDRQTSSDSYPLTGMRSGRNETRVTAPGDRNTPTHDNDTTGTDQAGGEPREIKVKRGWEIRTDVPRYQKDETV
ncbi:MAG: hypothetical protein Q9170_005174 [Blastenia crenularia]